MPDSGSVDIIFNSFVCFTHKNRWIGFICTTLRVVGGYQCCGIICCLHLQGRRLKLSYGSRFLWNIAIVCQVTWCHLLKDYCIDITAWCFHRNVHCWIPTSVLVVERQTWSPCHVFWIIHGDNVSSFVWDLYIIFIYTRTHIFRNFCESWQSRMVNNFCLSLKRKNDKQLVEPVVLDLPAVGLQIHQFLVYHW